MPSGICEYSCFCKSYDECELWIILEDSKYNIDNVVSNHWSMDKAINVWFSYQSYINIESQH